MQSGSILSQSFNRDHLLLFTQELDCEGTLDDEGHTRLWERQLKLRIEDHFYEYGMYDVVKKASHEWCLLPLNGRQIYNYFEVATALAKAEREDLTEEAVFRERHVEKPLSMMDEFKKYMSEVAPGEKKV